MAIVLSWQPAWFIYFDQEYWEKLDYQQVMAIIT